MDADRSRANARKRSLTPPAGPHPVGTTATVAISLAAVGMWRLQRSDPASGTPNEVYFWIALAGVAAAITLVLWILNRIETSIERVFRLEEIDRRYKSGQLGQEEHATLETVIMRGQIYSPGFSYRSHELRKQDRGDYD